MRHVIGYWLVKNISIASASCNQSAFTMGVPAMTAVGGLSHALERRIKQELNEPALRVSGFNIVYHAAEIHSGIKRSNFQMHSHNVKDNIMKKPRTANPEMSVRCSFIFELSIHHDDDELIEDLEFTMHQWAQTGAFNRLITGFKLAGGNIKPWVDNSGTKKRYASIWADTQLELAKQMLDLPQGSWVKDRTDLMQRYTQMEGCAMRALMKACYVRKETILDNDSGLSFPRYSRAQKEMIAPMQVGFSAIEQPRYRNGAISKDQLHVFAEPIITLIEFESIKRQLYKGIKDKKIKIPMWSHYNDLTKGMYLIRSL